MPFAKGVSGNPRGRTKSHLFSESIRMYLSRPVKDDAEDRTYREIMVEKLITAAIGGDFAAMREVMDRTEGKPAQTLQGDPSKPLELRITVAYEERIPRRSQETS